MLQLVDKTFKQVTKDKEMGKELVVLERRNKTARKLFFVGGELELKFFWTVTDFKKTLLGSFNLNFFSKSADLKVTSTSLEKFSINIATSMH